MAGNLHDTVQIPKILAGTLRFLVRIVTELHEVSLLRVLKCTRKQSAFASEVVPRHLRGAVDKLLNRELGEDTVLLLDESFEGCRDHEGPARTALSLHLRWRYRTLFSPVHVVIERCSVQQRGLALIGGNHELLIPMAGCPINHS